MRLTYVRFMMIACPPPVCTATTRREFLAIMAAAGLLSGCAGGSDSGPAGATSRRVEHPLGVTDIPVSPSRVVAIDRRGTLPHLLALGIEPVGALTHESIIGSQFPGVVADLTGDVTVLPTAGSSDEVRLEAVAALRPDLVLGWTDGITDQYDALTRIAPTVAVDIDVHDAEPSLRAIAAAVGRDERAEEIITGFEAQRTQRLEALGEIGTVSAVLGVGDQIRVYRPRASSVTRWLQEAGGRIVPDAGTLAGEPYRDLFVTVGQELLGEVNGDTLIVMANSGPDGEAALDALRGNALWSGLPAVRTGRVIRLDSQESVGYFGYQGYNAVLDSLTEQWAALTP
ncbi:putative siderophore-binding lipoprotein YfiY precursor [Pseudonocardia autotrophica]|uniref:Putative siderophore-binding lipoprotein YfiY n=1 Tax=Pseudonocardia autotrophica TaxID=2074 RepID=A0A1Y2MKB0_PSEAH|nr:putative siderophore-binding lipoprotein YfiY precursor [Pseudonocardia autotrophica]